MTDGRRVVVVRLGLARRVVGGLVTETLARIAGVVVPRIEM